MARSWHYPRWRRYAMQVAMWVILGATVGLAAFVNHERRRSMRVELGPLSSHGWLVLRLPKSWQQATTPDRDGRILARAIEPDEQGLGRTVTITRDRVAEPISPLQFLLSSNNQILGLDLLLAQHGRDPQQQQQQQLVEPIAVGGWPGVLVRGVRGASRAGAATGLPHKEVYGATVVPSGYAIVVKLEGDRPAELSDVEIVKQLAGAIEINAQPSLGQPGEIIALDGGIRFAAPDNFRPVYESAPNLLRRRLWPDGDATRWTAAELIPCLLAPEENADETLAIKTLAALHDPMLRDASVAPDGPRRWRINPPVAAGPFAPRGYFLVDERGDAEVISGGPRRALMAFFHGSADDGGAEAADAAWDAIARSVSFVGKTELLAQLDAGRDEVERLRKATLSSLLPARGEQWWLWSDENEKDHANVGWSHITWNVNQKNDAASDKTSGRSDTVFVSGGEKERWSTNWMGELRRYETFTTLTPADPTAEPVMQHAALTLNNLAIKLASRGRSIADGSGPTPGQFIPGAWLPLLVGKLSNRPMILFSDAFLSRDPIGAPRPMLLIVQPITEQPPTTDNEGTVLRCLSIRVNGSGEASRWYLRGNGDVHHVTFARGIQRTPSDEKTVWFTFGPDAARP